MEKISVAVCTFNGAQFIEKQLTSIAEQSQKVDEIVICDDGSTDDTLLVSKKIGEKYPQIDWHVMENSRNLGTLKNFEKAISLCTGNFIFTSDQDDIWNRDKVKITMEYFKRHPDCVLAFSDAWLIRGSSMERTGTLWKMIDFSAEEQKNILEGDPYKTLFRHNVVTGAVMAVESGFAKKCLPVPEKAGLHDAWFALCAPLYGDIGMIREKLICYRQHENNQVGAAGWKQDLERWKKTPYAPWKKSTERCISFCREKLAELGPDQKRKFAAWSEFNEGRRRLGQKTDPVWMVKNLLNGNYARFAVQKNKAFLWDACYCAAHHRKGNQR